MSNKSEGFGAITNVKTGKPFFAGVRTSMSKPAPKKKAPAKKKKADSRSYANVRRAVFGIKPNK